MLLAHIGRYWHWYTLGFLVVLGAVFAWFETLWVTTVVALVGLALLAWLSLGFIWARWAAAVVVLIISGLLIVPNLEGIGQLEVREAALRVLEPIATATPIAPAKIEERVAATVAAMIDATATAVAKAAAATPTPEPVAESEASGCVTTAKAQEMLGLNVQRLGTEPCSWVWRGMQGSKVSVADGFIGTLHLVNDRKVVTTAPGPHQVLAGTFRYRPGFPQDDAVHSPCQLLFKEQEFGKKEVPSFDVQALGFSCP